MNPLRFALFVALALLVSGLIAPPSSYASTLTFELTSDHCTGGCLTGQARGGTITVTDAGGGVDLTLTLEHGNLLIAGGIGGGFDFVFNLVGNPSITYSGATGGWGATSPQAAGSIHFDGLGDFEYGLTCTSCGSGGGGGVAGPFTIHIAGATTASFQANSDGHYFGVDIFSGTTGKTGAVDAGPAVPEPSTIALYALGFAMLVAGQQWRKSRLSRARIEIV